VYCEILPYYKYKEPIENLKGVILSGSPHSVRDKDAPQIDFSVFRHKVPLLGICYGAQLMAQNFGGSVQASATREYGRAQLSKIEEQNLLFKGIEENSQVWMSHGDTIVELPANVKRIAETNDVKNAAFCFVDELTFGIQFHPEVFHSTQGTLLLENFLKNICSCKQNWTSNSFIESTVEDLKRKLTDDKVVLGLSGGVDSSVAAMLLHKAIGKNLHCIFVDNGLLRKDEFDQVLDSYKHLGLNVKGVRAADKFYAALKNISDPELKRKAIGKTFIEVFDEEAHLISDVKWLAQGTIYPDVIESVSVKGPSATIKSHHNVGGLPDYMKLQIVEPLRNLFKDEVRRTGAAMGMHADLLGRHPFPGPGLAIRILGDITPEKVQLLQEADHIFISLLKQHDLYKTVWQAGVIFLPIQSVGVMGDERTYENAVALRAVSSTDGMTADWCHLPYDFLAKVSNEIINKVRGINRVVYDISSKPPATIEWE
jgi:GMP synthase (glutamine-hydrolysing)